MIFKMNKWLLSFLKHTIPVSSPVLEPTYCFGSYPGHRGCEELLVGVHANKPTTNPALYKPSSLPLPLCLMMEMKPFLISTRL